MRRDEVIERLRQHEGEIRALGVDALFLFGSHARDQAGPGSDVDVFVDEDGTRKFGFLEYTGLIHMLEDLFECEVDVATRASLHPVLKSEIESSAVRVF